MCPTSALDKRCKETSIFGLLFFAEETEIIMILSDATMYKIIHCSKKCSNHLHSLKDKEEHAKKLSVCNVTACASLFFSKQQLIISAKPSFIGSIPIAASNLFNNLESPMEVTLSFCVRNVCEFYNLKNWGCKIITTFHY
jgi:hypothetical protein